ncbi:MAG: hypothetical protein RIF46_10450 [Cyclobacteriaceae bacterium]
MDASFTLLTTMNRQFRLPLFITSLLLSSLAFGQTIDEASCSDGVDGGNGTPDGFIDCYDNECINDNACNEFFFGNDVTCTDEPDVTNFSIRQQWGSANRTANSHATPMIGDLDDDGIPEVIVNNRQDENFFVLNGATGATIVEVDLGWEPENVMATARMRSDDECALIFAYRERNRNMAMYDYCDLLDGNFTPKWTASASESSIGYPGFADFNQDGVPELYHNNEIRNAETGAILVDGHANMASGETWLRNIA